MEVGAERTWWRIGAPESAEVPNSQLFFQKKKRAPNATPIPSTSSLPEKRLQTVGTELARAVFCAERQLQLGRGGQGWDLVRHEPGVVSVSER